ncbi:MAG: hypothetical protein EOO40_00990 [Deltaproteobacteria bacterium]|nr:MAG: hypothetical protein EOO40_00990 [Deltaproteobacteria bacterium]
MPTPIVDTITPATVDTCGGNVVTLTGVFKQGGAYTVVCLPSDAPNQPSLSNAYRHKARAVQAITPYGFKLCYSGKAGQGVFCRCTDGQTLQFVTPRVKPGPLNVIVTDAATGENAYAYGVDGLTAAAPFLSSMTYTLRSTLPLAYATGPRHVMAIAVPDIFAQVDI